MDVTGWGCEDLKSEFGRRTRLDDGTAFVCVGREQEGSVVAGMDEACRRRVGCACRFVEVGSYLSSYAVARNYFRWGGRGGVKLQTMG